MTAYCPRGQALIDDWIPFADDQERKQRKFMRHIDQCPQCLEKWIDVQSPFTVYDNRKLRARLKQLRAEREIA